MKAASSAERPARKGLESGQSDESSTESVPARENMDRQATERFAEDLVFSFPVPEQMALSTRKGRHQAGKIADADHHDHAGAWSPQIPDLGGAWSGRTREPRRRGSFSRRTTPSLLAIVIS